MDAVAMETRLVIADSKMSVTSKTGLLPTVRRVVKAQAQVQEIGTIQMPNLAVPATLTLRPFAGVYNPFPSGCSILCNHPANFEAKLIVKKAKDAWATEGKSLVEVESMTAVRQEKEQEAKTGNEDSDQVPEELFRKYTDTDSRPLTPAPTLASVGTKVSQNLRSRRCMTPDPMSFLPAKEKTLLVLDLRRSHSQETVFWQGGQAPDEEAKDPSSARTNTPSSPQTKRKKTPRKKPTTASARTSSLRSENSRDSDSKVQSSGNQSPSKGSLIQEQEPGKVNSPQVSRESSTGDLGMVKRRGKKRKGKKMGRDGDKEFKGIPDPGETQVSALENDSKEGSSRPSLTGEENNGEMHSEGIYPAIPEARPEEEEDNRSFLKTEILKLLQRQLDQEVVDSEFNAKRKIALEEALKLKPNLKHVQQGEEMKNLKKEFQLPIKNSEKWLSIPRVFTRRSARFELPMDSRLLNNMTPLQYVQTYVFASPERLVLYNHVFNLYKEEPEDDEETERVLLGKNVVTALSSVMGRVLTEEESKNFQSLLDWKDDASLDFRTFAGISATCERLLGPGFCSKMPSQAEDPRDPVEIADFETLDGKLLRLNPDRRLVRILKSVRDL